jgi:hypothetical protein
MRVLHQVLAGAVGAILAVVAVRACAPPSALAPSGDLPADLAADVDAGRAELEDERAQAQAAADCQIDEINAAADAELQVPLVDWLNRPPPPSRRPAAGRSDARAPSSSAEAIASPAAAEEAPCREEAGGWVRCPATLLERVRLTLVDAQADAGTLAVRLELSEEERRIDAAAAGLQLGAYAKALGRAQGEAREAEAGRTLRVAGGIAGGAAVVTGIALAAAGHGEAGAVVGGAGAVLATVVLVF